MCSEITDGDGSPSTEDVTVYLIGTAHLSQESSDDVRKVGYAAANVHLVFSHSTADPACEAKICNGRAMQ